MRKVYTQNFRLTRKNIELTGEDIIYPIKPGTMYALNGHEKHCRRAKSNMRLVCVFNPIPLVRIKKPMIKTALTLFPGRNQRKPKIF